MQRPGTTPQTGFTTLNEISFLLNKGDGEYIFRVRAIDNAGNVGEWSSEFNVMLDRTPPEAIIADDIPYLNELYYLSEHVQS